MFDIKPIIEQNSNKKTKLKKKKKPKIRKKDFLVKSRLKNQILILNWYYKQERKKRILVLVTLLLLIIVIFLLLFKGFFVKNYCESKGLMAGFGSVNKKNNNPFEGLVYSGADSGVCGEATKETWTEKPKYDLCKKGCPSSVAIDQNGKVYSWACLYQDENNNSLNSYCQANKSQDGITNFYYQQQDKINTTQTGQSCSVYNKSGDIVNNLNNIYYISNKTASGGKTETIDRTTTKVIENNTTNQPIIQTDNTQFNDQIDEINQKINNLSIITPAPTIKIDGLCGNSHQKVLQSEPTTNLCATGVPSKVTNLSTWFWVCYGLNDGENDHCYSQKMIEPIAPEDKIDGVCGSSHGQTLDEAPTQDLCTSGTPSNVVGDGPWYWDCLPSGGGQVQKCQAQAPTINAETVIGACGPAHTTGFYSIPTESDGLCSTGVAGKINGSGPWNWSCYGTDLLNSDLVCEAYVRLDGVCGSANGTNSYTQPSSFNLCNAGIATSINNEATKWTWNCNGEHGGDNPLCETGKIINGVCGSSHNKTEEPSYAGPTTNLCSVGNNSTVEKIDKSFTFNSQPNTAPAWKWTCSSVNGGNVPNCYTCSWNYQGVYNQQLRLISCLRASICPNTNNPSYSSTAVCDCCTHGGFTDGHNTCDTCP